jgi:hypothetical protein
MLGVIRTKAKLNTSTCLKSRLSYRRKRQFERRLSAVHKNKDETAVQVQIVKDVKEKK